MAESSSDLLSMLQASARNGTLLSSCEPEVKELMHQLDVIISAKQREWERERTSLLIKLECKERETASLRKNILEKNSEIDQVKVIQRSIQEEYHVRHADQEAQLLKLRSEVKRLNHNYELLKAKRSQHTRGDEDNCSKQQCQSLKHQVKEFKETISLLEQQLKRREHELTMMEEDKGQKMSILNESLKTKDELIRTLEDQLSLTNCSVQFSSYEAEMKQLRETINDHVQEKRHLMRELKSMRHESQHQFRENQMIMELEDRVQKLETQLQEAQTTLHDTCSSKAKAISKFVNQADQVASSEDYSRISESGLSQTLEGILDKHFNQLDSSLHAILLSSKS